VLVEWSDSCLRLTRGLIINLLVAMSCLALLAWLTIKYAPAVTEMASNPERLRTMILSYGHLGVLVYIGIQIVQIIITAIPGEVVQVAGGYIYGTWLATTYLLVGVVVGSLTVFGLARIAGYSLVKQLVSEEKLTRFADLMTSKKAYSVIFVLFLIPGLPKDLLTYVGGLTPVKPLQFIIIASIARIPGVFFSAYIGANLQERDFLTAIVLSVAAVLLFVLGVLYRDQILAWLQRFSFFKQEDN